MLSQPVTDKDIHEGPCNNKAGKFKFVHNAMQGWRENMEDAYEIFSPPEGSFLAFAVYDGHGGDNVAIKASKYCIKHIIDEEKFKVVLKGDTGTSDEEKIKMLVEAFEQGMLKCDMRIREENKVDGEDCDESGCTANVNLITPEFLTCGNLGDTRSVLCRDGEVIEMSHDHKPTNPDETKRIEAAGARVTRKRVNAAIAVSRSLGDYFFKSNEDENEKIKHHWEQPLTCKPEVITRRRQIETDEFIVCCCDGIWDVMTNKQVVDFIRNKLKEGEASLSLISTELINNCLKAGSKDNMSVVILLLEAGEDLIPKPCCTLS